ncbi:ISL3 family transposase, partial [Staphylococcus coagulans]|nr:ISL3 family transposase [Staphylococcus coagulans]MDU9293716.1 ISL3 family transposase [Staphylococcus coagulans]MDU9305997.1 ISL3 family transposase [Staphylococcus coagulans]MDU9323093.1 ISL3 family transposase [Staphylococcus coagulans]MDU9335308.1 ISL3 family transposase [Staphylococcus coagulans]
MNGFRTKDRPQYNKLKRYWKLLLKAPLDLDRMIYQSYGLFKSWQSQYSLVQYLLGLDERLKETYETGHRLLSALKANDIQQLQFILQDSKTKDISQGLKRVIQT